MKSYLRLIGLCLLCTFVFIFAGCGEKSAEDVLKKANEQLEKLDGYKAKAKMSMKTGEQEQMYDLNVWYKAKDFYRVALTNVDDEKANQIILKNKDGVFVVTPTLNKSFKFQSDWPKTSSQPYLYQSLLSDIEKDEGAEFEITETHYIFTTKTNYESNKNLPKQQIYLNKKTYAPEIVKVLDKDEQSLVEVTFESFELAPTFEKDDFMLQEKEESKETATGQTEETVLDVMYPEETIGSKLEGEEVVELDNGKRHIMTYEGKKNFTLVQEVRSESSERNRPREVNGQIVNLGSTIGAISGNTIQWSERGNHYKLASEELTRGELISVAKSLQKQQTK